MIVFEITSIGNLLFVDFFDQWSYDVMNRRLTVIALVGDDYAAL